MPERSAPPGCEASCVREVGVSWLFTGVGVGKRYCDRCRLDGIIVVNSCGLGSGNIGHSMTTRDLAPVFVAKQRVHI